MNESASEEIAALKTAFAGDLQCQGMNPAGMCCANRASYQVLFSCTAKPNGNATGFLCKTCLGMLLNGYRCVHPACGEPIDPETIRVV